MGARDAGGAQRRDALRHLVLERGVERAVVAPAGDEHARGAWVGARRRGAAPEVLQVLHRPVEGLADQLGADDLAVLLDQAAVRLVAGRARLRRAR